MPLIPLLLLSIIFYFMSMIKFSIENLLSSSIGVAYAGLGDVTKKKIF
jgi:hypothetical protein